MDMIQRALAYEDRVLVSAAETTELVNEAIRLHGLWAVTAAALGRALTAGAMMGADLKNQTDSLTLTIAGGGPAGNLVVSAEGGGAGGVRGYVDNPAVDLPLNAAGKLDVGGAVGRTGRLSVVRSMGMKKPYAGQVPLISGEIAEDIAYYYACSEQKPTAVALGVLVDTDGSCRAAGGVFVHILPGCPDPVADRVQEAVEKLSNISRVVENCAPREILLNTFGPGLRFTEEIYPAYRCRCSLESIQRVLLSLGEEEARSILADQGRIEIQCHFCGKRYVFSREETETLFSEGRKKGREVDFGRR